ncbi:MAG: thiamine phosphate synthase [Sphingobacteriales bacterium]|nr:thiamine phosphate synthase [Sphingobacteriales bacterium]
MKKSTEINQSINRSSFIVHRFHYLTQDLPDISHQELAEIACENGIRWIQLRVKNKSYEEWLQIAKEVKSVCDKYQTILIINDNVEICKAIDAHGVHLGKNDMSVAEARAILGKDKIIGGTANTVEDIEYLQSTGVDYIGLGPYKFTETKKNLNSIVGLQGYSAMLQFYNSTIPVIAIGGIKLEDVKSLMNTGVYGIAVSSVINLAEDKAKVINSFLELL